MSRYMTLGRAACDCRVPEAVFRKACNDGIIQPSALLGRWRVFRAEDLPAIREKLRQHGLVQESAS